MKKPLTPQEFANAMRKFSDHEKYDPEGAHIEADKLMGQLLTVLGYGEGVLIFAQIDKWYS